MTREGRGVASKEPPEQRTSEPATGLLSSAARIPTFRALTYRNFRYLWFGQLCNSAAIWIEQVARPILILHLSNSPVHLGLVLGTRALPQLLFGLLGGVLADWFDRRTLMLLSKSMSMTIDFSFAILILSGRAEIWHVYVASFLKGMSTSFDQPARQALIPRLVPETVLTNAVALNSASMNVMRTGGAFLAGVLMATVGVGETFLTGAFMTTFAVVFTFLMRVPPVKIVVRDKGVGAAATSFVEGARYAWETSEIRGVLILLLCYFGIAMSYMQVFSPLLAKETMGLGDSGFGFMIATVGIGSLFGALTIATIAPRRWRGPAMLGLMATLGILLSLFGASTYLPHAVLTFFLIGLVGMAQSSFNAIGNTILLETASPEKQGRVMGLMSLDRSMITFGGTIAGFLAAAIGAQLAQMTFGVALILIAVAMAGLVPAIRRMQ